MLHRLGGHPYIVTVTCVFVDKQDVYMQMPFYAEGTLAAWMETSPSFEAARCALRQLLLALQRIHGLKIIHCDIKPDNIFLECQNPPAPPSCG